MHVTLADTFAIDSVQADLISQLSISTRDYRMKIRGERTAHFGKEKEIEVTILYPSRELTELHYIIADLLLNKGASFNDPQYIKSGFVGHVTKQKERALDIESESELSSLALIDMFPGGDPYARKVIKIINMKEG